MHQVTNQTKCLLRVHGPRVYPGAHLLTKKPEDPGYEIDQATQDREAVAIEELM